MQLYKKMIKMKNEILYDYEKISKEDIYMIINENLSDFDIAIEDFKRNIKN